MQLKSVRNFRDIGGLPVNGSGIIKPGLIYRSATVDYISRSDINILRDLNIRTIVDLRAPQEAGRFRNVIKGIEYVSLPLDFQNTTRERIKPYIYKKGSEKILADISHQLYLDILDTSVPVFRQLIELLIEGNSVPLLIHCQAGKDRTGIIIALLLMVFGTDRESIRSDFLKSNEELLPYYKKLMAIRKILTFGRFPADQMLQVVTVKERNIDSVIDRVQNHYKGVEGYLSSAGFEASKLKELREKFCEV